MNETPRRINDLPEAERMARARQAMAQLGAELQANAAEISRIMDEAAGPILLPEIVLILTEFQAAEVEHGLDIDAADHPDDPDWGRLEHTGRRQRTARLIIAGTQLARDRALYRITSSRDIWLDNAGDSFGTHAERLACAARGRSLAGLTAKLIDAAGGPEGFSPEYRRWIRY